MSFSKSGKTLFLLDELRLIEEIVLTNYTPYVIMGSSKERKEIKMEYVEKKIKLITLDKEELEKINEAIEVLMKLGDKMVEHTHHITPWVFRDESGYTIDKYSADTIKGLVNILDKLYQTDYLETSSKD